MLNGRKAGSDAAWQERGQKAEKAQASLGKLRDAAATVVERLAKRRRENEPPGTEREREKGGREGRREGGREGGREVEWVGGEGERPHPFAAASCLCERPSACPCS